MNDNTPSHIAADADGTQRQQHLTFTVGGETFAVSTLNVREIMAYGQLTEVPLMAACVRGVINLRGAVVPVIDLKARFGGAPTTMMPRTCVIILEVVADDETLVLGAIVDAVSEVLEIGPDEIKPAPAFGSRIRTDFIEGIARVGDAFVILLDLGQVLAIDEISACKDIPFSSQAVGHGRPALTAVQ